MPALGRKRPPNALTHPPKSIGIPAPLSSPTFTPQSHPETARVPTSLPIPIRAVPSPWATTASQKRRPGCRFGQSEIFGKHVRDLFEFGTGSGEWNLLPQLTLCLQNLQCRPICSSSRAGEFRDRFGFRIIENTPSNNPLQICNFPQ